MNPIIRLLYHIGRGHCPHCSKWKVKSYKMQWGTNKLWCGNCNHCWREKGRNV